MPAAHNHSGAPTKRVVPRSRCTHRFADDASRSLGSEDASSIVRHVREDDREREEQEAQQEEPHETVALAAHDRAGQNASATHMHTARIPTITQPVVDIARTMPAPFLRAQDGAPVVVVPDGLAQSCADRARSVITPTG